MITEYWCVLIGDSIFFSCSSIFFCFFSSYSFFFKVEFVYDPSSTSATDGVAADMPESFKVSHNAFSFMPSSSPYKMIFTPTLHPCFFFFCDLVFLFLSCVFNLILSLMS